MAYSGTVQACIQHMVQAVGEDQAARVLALFTKANARSTAARWVRGRNMPQGNFLARLMYGLELLGYEIHEYRRLPKCSKTLIRLVALEIVTPEYLQGQLNYRDSKSLWRVALMGKKPTIERQYRIELLEKFYEADIKAAIDRWSTELEDTRLSCQQRLVDDKGKVSSDEGGTAVTVAPTGATIGNRASARMLANLVQCLGLVLEELGEVNAASPEVISAFTSVSPKHVTRVAEFLMCRLPS